MRSFLFILALSLCGLVLLAAPQARAEICNPSPGGAACLGSGCTQLGATTMDSDQKNLVACLKDDSGNQVWKGMSGTVSKRSCIQNSFTSNVGGVSGYYPVPDGAVFSGAALYVPGCTEFFQCHDGTIAEVYGSLACSPPMT